MGSIDSSHWINAFAILIIYSCQQQSATHSFIFIHTRAVRSIFLVAFVWFNENINTQVALVSFYHPSGPTRYTNIHNTTLSLTSHSFRTIGTTSTILNTNNNRRHVCYRTLFPFEFRLWNILKQSLSCGPTYLFIFFVLPFRCEILFSSLFFLFSAI